MLDASASACPDGPAVSQAERLARIANSPAAQAVVDQAPTLTRQQLDAARAACASATARHRAIEGKPAERDPAIPGQLRARRDAANRMPPLPNGVRDPFGATA